jgi:hypothetical protein
MVRRDITFTARAWDGALRLAGRRLSAYHRLNVDQRAGRGRSGGGGRGGRHGKHFRRRVRAGVDELPQGDDIFVVAVNCGEAGGTCLCVSTGTGPR